MGGSTAIYERQHICHWRLCFCSTQPQLWQQMLLPISLSISGSWQVCLPACVRTGIAIIGYVSTFVLVSSKLEWSGRLLPWQSVLQYGHVRHWSCCRLIQPHVQTVMTIPFTKAKALQYCSKNLMQVQHKTKFSDKEWTVYNIQSQCATQTISHKRTKLELTMHCLGLGPKSRQSAEKNRKTIESMLVFMSEQDRLHWPTFVVSEHPLWDNLETWYFTQLTLVSSGKKLGGVLVSISRLFF